jgi:hypothetical protein
MTITVPFKDYMRAHKEDVHVLPLGDVKAHRETRACWCAPRTEPVGKCAVVVHNSMDGRELVERHGLQ